MLAHPENPKPVGRAFTLIEVLIVLALLIGVSAAVLPRLIDRGLGDVLDDTRLRLDAAMLDAQREARRTGRTVEVSLRTDTDRDTTEILIQTMLADGETTMDDAAPAPEERDSWWGAEDSAEFGVSDGLAPPTSDGARADDRGGVLVYVLPDGTLVPAASRFVLELDGATYNLAVDTGAGRVSFTPSRADDSDTAAPDEPTEAEPGVDEPDHDPGEGRSP